MQPIPNNPAVMRELIERAIRSQDLHVPGSIDEEHLALLAEGRFDALSPQDRQKLLEQVAADPESAELLRELVELQDQQSLRIETAETKSKTIFGASPSTIFQITKHVWAVAACMVITLGTWRAMSPILTPEPAHVISKSPNVAPAVPATPAMPTSSTALDIALLLSGCILLVSTIPIALRLRDRRNKAPNPPHS